MTMKKRLLWGSIGVLTLASMVVIGCSVAQPSNSYIRRPLTINPGRSLTEEGVADPLFQLGDYFDDGTGRLRDPLVFGYPPPYPDEVWVISKPSGSGDTTNTVPWGSLFGVPVDTDGDGIPDTITYGVGAGGSPNRNTQGFGPIALPQNTFNLVDLLGNFGSDSFAGEILNNAPVPLLGDIPIIGAAFADRDDIKLTRDDLAYLSWLANCGGLVGVPMRETAEPTLVPMPLQHTNVTADVAAYIASVEVTQQFHNPYDGKIEAVYVFPLPQDAAVNEFIMRIGDRTIRGIIREREEAKRIYEDARAQGYHASLLTQERPNIFTQKVANLEPNERIDISIRYFNTLAYRDGWYEFVYPMVVGPRFNPPGSTQGVGAVERGQHGISGQATEVQYLAPGERSGHDIALSVNLDAGVEVEEIECTSHAIETHRESASGLRISLSPNDTIPNKDFVLRYRVAGDRIKASMLTHAESPGSGDSSGGHFTFMLYPPQELADIDRAPIEMIFVLDCSGSMNGVPIEQAKRAAERGLKLLRPTDTFQIIRFSNDASALGPQPLAATTDNVRRGVRYLQSLNGNGGTMMIEGIKAALDFPHEDGRQRYVAFLTDGYIGNDDEILGAMKQRLRGARIFSFGIGSSVNRSLLERMASLGDGVAAFVLPGDSAVRVMDDFIARVAHPALADLSIDWGGLVVDQVFPRELPDLFVGRPITLTGRYRGTGIAQVTVQGRAGMQEIEIPVEVNVSDADAAHPAIAAVWARSHIADLSNRATYDANVKAELPDRITAVALEYGLVSAYTAFIAVDSSERTAGDHGTTVPVAVPVPDGVKYETAVTGGAKGGG